MRLDCQETIRAAIVASLLGVAGTMHAAEIALTIDPARNPAGAVGELKAAFLAAAADPDADIITLYPRGEYVFADGERWDQNGPNLLPPRMEGDLVLVGGGASLILAEDAPAARFLAIGQHASLMATQLSFVGGRAAETEGPIHLRYAGAIWTDGPVFLSQCVFENNTAPANGGAIAALWNARLMIDDCRFTANESGTYGGAIDSVGTAAVLENSLFERNSAKWEGGAVGTFRPVAIKQCSFTENHAGTNGGAVRNTGSMVLEASTFRENKADQVGGAVANIGEAAQLEIVRCTFLSNQSKLNGGAFDARFGKAWILDSHFEANSSGGKGGAIGSWGVLSVRKCVFFDNVAKGDGGAVLNHKGMLLADSTFEGNTAGGSGGALCDDKRDARGLSTLVTGCTIRGNLCLNGDGGGIAVLGEEGVALSATILTANADQGGQAHDTFGRIASGGSNHVDIAPPTGFPFDSTGPLPAD